ncbi:hypothetical protein CQW23_31213 [Capsicum baccatum]|uniref:Rab-GAP TBC domain-containing protein n=1 Tax=Capsicum baccatum TaxID=33114 RepID=A0A2G2V8H5_CAPBA|nr:hypothetical protein CQW23_31213 [Capsicum baccatum]
MRFHGCGTSNGVCETLECYNISEEDHPVSLEISEQMDRDFLLIHQDLEFFSGDSPLSRKNRESMRNILLLFAKLNPAISYVQGMNEV